VLNEVLDLKIYFIENIILLNRFLPIAKRLWTSSQVNESSGTSSDAATIATVDKFLFNAVAWSWNSSK
jgi:hypothetical protein